MSSSLCLGVLGRLELPLGNVEAAGRYLRGLPGRLLASGMNDPTQPIWPDAIETLIARRGARAGHVYLDRPRTRCRDGRERLGTAGASRCRGLLAAAEGDRWRSSDARARARRDRSATPTPSNGDARC